MVLNPDGLWLIGIFFMLEIWENILSLFIACVFTFCHFITNFVSNNDRNIFLCFKNLLINIYVR